ncbi:hypothetical protein B5X24_HaOG202778 [Helicoverpa armigera]|uniref:Secreted protein n=1 Tax=Helicoverpa armigera TaxID=29058 RepID=A0A2W1BXF8_HELAM|nr:hypothetical protein B5X24_HaOG202778 [Helicoverpa armigera]
MRRLCGSSCVAIAIFAIAIFMAIIGNCKANCIGQYLFQNARRNEPEATTLDNLSYTIRRGPSFPKKAKDKTTAGRRRNRCCPYEFDGNDCRVLDDRVLCGYDKNVGKPKSKRQMVEMTGGCRLRGGRLECGYAQGPYTNPRRPPVWDNPPFNSGAEGDGTGNGISDDNPGRGSTRRPAAVTKCMEVNNRIVCRKV